MKRLILLIVLLNSACSLTPKQHTNKHDLGITKLSANTKTELNVTAADWLHNDCIHYRLVYATPTELRCYNLDQWIAPPTDLLKQQLSYQLSSKHRLLIEVSEFEQRFDTANTAKVLMSLRVSSYRAPTDALLATKTFQFSENTAPNAKGAVTGFAHLTQQAVTKIQHWLNTINSQ